MKRTKWSHWCRKLHGNMFPHCKYSVAWPSNYTPRKQTQENNHKNKIDKHAV